MIHVLVVLECVLLMIIGLDKIIAVPVPEQAVESSAPGMEAKAEYQIGAIRSAIVQVAAAAGPESAPPLPMQHGIQSPELFVPPPGAEALLRPESPDQEVLASSFGSEVMREADRLAIARDLLGSVVGDRLALTKPAEIIADNPTTEEAPIAGSVTALPHPTKASRLETPQSASAPLAQPVARPASPAGFYWEDGLPEHKAGRLKVGETSAAGAPASAKVAEVQRLLARLGFQVGEIDGVLGRRTEFAIRSFQQRRGTSVDGRIDDDLMTQLRRSSTRKQGAAPALAPGYGAAREDAGWFTSMVAGFQRLVGHNFDSISRPWELQAYCRRQADTWVYDEVSGRLLHCGQVIASK